MLNEPSDRFSNIDSISNLGFKKTAELASGPPKQYCSRRLAQQRRPPQAIKAEKKMPIVVSKNMVNFNPIAKINVETINEELNPFKTSNSSF
jgi:hypothetical protein